LRYTDPTGHKPACGLYGEECSDEELDALTGGIPTGGWGGVGNDDDDNDDPAPNPDAELSTVEPSTLFPCLFSQVCHSIPFLHNFNALTSCNINDNISCILGWLIPSHSGWRGQLDVGGNLAIPFLGYTGPGGNVSIGVQFLYDRYSGQVGADVDWGYMPTYGLGGLSVLGTTGPVMGWGAGDLRPLMQTPAEGIIAISGSDVVGGTASANIGGVDPVSGFNPLTFYVGGGFGTPKAAAGGAGFNRIFGGSWPIFAPVWTP